METVERNFFAINELPILATEKNTKEQIKLCFDAKNSDSWEVIFD
jgi:hypothetical protein